jgi:hypothetical protein
MAKHQQDREDLLREATALTHRVELQLPGESETLVIGFRRHGEASVFIGADPVFQFNSHNQLRRAFLDDKLVKAERGQLVWLERRRLDEEVQLIRRDFDPGETAEVIGLAQRHLDRLRQALAEHRYRIIGQVPDDGDVVAEVTDWLRSLPDEIQIADTPRVSE